MDEKRDDELFEDLELDAENADEVKGGMGPGMFRPGLGQAVSNRQPGAPPGMDAAQQAMQDASRKAPGPQQDAQNKMLEALKARGPGGRGLR